MIHRIIVGPLKTNCYIVFDEETLQGMIVDPGFENEEITKYIKDNKLKIEKIYLTHCHFDHIGGVEWLRNMLEVPVIAFHCEEEGIKNKDINLSEFVTGHAISVNCDKLVFEKEEISVGSIIFKVIHTPGHTSGSTCLFDGENLLSGDTIFADTCGRTDLPTSSRHDIVVSIEKLLSLPPNTKVYPGHGEITTIESVSKLEL